MPSKLIRMDRIVYEEYARKEIKFFNMMCLCMYLMLRGLLVFCWQIVEQISESLSLYVCLCMASFVTNTHRSKCATNQELLRRVKNKHAADRRHQWAMLAAQWAFDKHISSWRQLESLSTNGSPPTAAVLLQLSVAAPPPFSRARRIGTCAVLTDDCRRRCCLTLWLVS